MDANKYVFTWISTNIETASCTSDSCFFYIIFCQLCIQLWLVFMTSVGFIREIVMAIYEKEFLTLCNLSDSSVSYINILVIYYSSREKYAIFVTCLKRDLCMYVILRNPVVNSLKSVKFNVFWMFWVKSSLINRFDF